MWKLSPSLCLWFTRRQFSRIWYSDPLTLTSVSPFTLMALGLAEVRLSIRFGLWFLMYHVTAAIRSVTMSISVDCFFFLDIVFFCLRGCSTVQSSLCKPCMFWWGQLVYAILF